MPRALKTISRFETEILTSEENAEAPSAINRTWVSRAVRATRTGKIILDMDSSESPVHGGQEGSEYNGQGVNRWKEGTRFPGGITA